MDATTRILVAIVSAIFLVVYFGWKWKRAGQYVANQEASRDRARLYFDAIQRDPRWLTLKAHIDQRYPLGTAGVRDPSLFVLHHVALVDDHGFTYRLDNPNGPTRIVALIVRQQPPTQLFLSMSLTTGELREDPAPHGWTYVGPPR